jgi:glycosyltransferase involved in cell wall biosynthesis
LEFFLRLAIVIPAYNEQFAINHVLSDIQHVFKHIPHDVIVVDDGSKDSTAKIALENNAIVISHILNSGSGAATTTGLTYAIAKNYDFAATLDADGQHSAKDLLNTFKYLQNNNYDLVIGSRLIDSKGMSTIKKVGNKGLSYFTFLLFGINVTDSQSGMRVFSRNALEKIQLKSTGYEFCSEMLWRAKQQRLAISEYPIQAIYTDYSKSKGQNNWNAFMIVRSLIGRRFIELLYE